MVFNEMTSMRKVFILFLLHEEEGVENPIGVFNSKEDALTFVQELQIEYDYTLEEGSDYSIYDVPYYSMN
jgi:hypothetical protein